MTFTKLISSNYKGELVKDSERVLERFLWFPKWIKGECRWLERARFRQIYTNYEKYSTYGCRWHEVEFINKDTTS